MIALIAVVFGLGLVLVGFSFQRQPDDLRLAVPSFSLSVLKSKSVFASLTASFIVFFGAIPDSLKPPLELSMDGLRSGYGFELITHAFMHWDFPHLASNVTAMLLLSSFWRQLRPWELLYLFLLGSVVSGVLSVYLMPESFFLGASGGIAAIGGTLLVRWKEIKNAKTLFIAVGCVILFYWMLNMSVQAQSHFSINHVAHLAGFLFGLTYPYQIRAFKMIQMTPS
jgi:membrane associated rhomboid family serine protease